MSTKKTKAQIEAENAALKAEIAKLEKPSTLQWLRSWLKANWTGLIVGAMLMLPFVSTGNPLQKIIRSNPVSLIVADSPQAIAKDAPNDPTKRKSIAEACKKTAEQIKSGTITTKSEMWTALTAQTVSAESDPTWNKTIDRINNIIAPIKDLGSLAGKLHEIAEAFEQ